MNETAPALEAVRHGKGYFLRRLLTEMPAVSSISGYPLPALMAKYVLYHLVDGMEFEHFRALRLYEYTRPRRREFLLTCHAMRFSDMLNAAATPEQIALLDDKHLFNRTFASFVRRDWLYLPDSSPEDIRAFLDRNSVFLAKEPLSTQGKNIRRFETSQLDREAFIREYGSLPFLLETFVQQHPALHALNPSTLNTIRLQTARKGEQVIFLGGCLRCGGADAFVDNFHAGGVAYPLDMDTGVVTAPGRKLTGELFRVHPSTGRYMPGFQVPLWDQVIHAVRTAALTVPNIGYVGWDVAVTADGPELIEGNINYPDSIVAQLDGVGCYQRLKDFVQQ